MALILTFQNVSALAPVSDYRVTVLVGDGGPSSRTIATGRVNGHPRDHGWKALVQQFLDEQQP